MRHIPSCEELFLFERLRKSPKQIEKWQLDYQLPALPEVTEEEAKLF
jgi:hypothetical protein